MGLKAGYRMADFGLDVTNPIERNNFKIFVKKIGKEYDAVVKGSFRGQANNGNIGDALFYIKGNDVVVTSLDGNFVTILENGVNSNTFVKRAIDGL